MGNTTAFPTPEICLKKKSNSPFWAQKSSPTTFNWTMEQKELLNIGKRNLAGSNYKNYRKGKKACWNFGEIRKALMEDNESRKN